MAIAMRGLRVKPSYEQLINVAVSDGLVQIKIPNRNATFFKKCVCSITIRWRWNASYGRSTKETH